jgi:hypothetical protein
MDAKQGSGVLFSNLLLHGWIRKVGVFIFLVTIIGISNHAAFAQSGAGTITGAVTDPKGLAVSGAKIVIHDTDTGIDRPVATTDAGIYSATFLESGHYDVTASKDGFATAAQKALTLQVGQTLTIDFALTVGTTSSQILVTAEAPLIEPDRTEVSQEVSDTLAAGLPLNGRRWEQFSLLTPGVTTDGIHGLTSYHGISGLFNNSSVDGTNNEQAFFSETRGRTSVAYVYSLDAIKEFNVSSATYSAEFGQAAGGQVNAVTKSGGNDVHGDIFYYLRYPSLNALDPYSRSHGIAATNGSCPANFLFVADVPLQCVALTDHQRQQFGGSGGGPIIKDKLFYFVNYDGQRRSFPIVYTGPSSTNAVAAVNSMIANDCTATVGSHVGATIVGLTAAQCSAAVNYITSNIGPQPRLADQDIYFGKLDYQINPNNHVSGSFNFMDWKAPNDYSTTPTFSAGSITQNGNYGTHERFLVADWNSVISSQVVNDFRFQWSRDFEFYTANFSGPSVSLSSLYAYGMPNALPRPAFPDEHRLQFTDTVSTVYGKHTMKYGLDINAVHDVLINLFQGGGIYAYSYSDTSAATSAATLQAWIADVYNLPLSTDPSTTPALDTLLGKHYNTFQQAQDPITGVGKDDFYDMDYAGFFQDTWKTKSNLTLNIGLRYDVQHVPQPQHPNTTSSLATYYTNTVHTDFFDFGPRLGVAWSPSKNMVVRGGYGIFYGKTSNSLYYDTRVENGVYQQTFNCNSGYSPSLGTGGNSSTCAPIFPNIIFSALGPPLQAPFTGAVVPKVTPASPSNLVPISFRGQTPGFLEPMVHQAEAAVERQLPWNMTVSGTYLFTRGQHLPVCADANLAAPGTPVTAGTPPSTITYTVAGPSSGQTFYGGVPIPAAGSVTVPFFTSRLSNTVGIVASCESIVHSLYNAGVFTVKKQFSHGFELLANYTVAKTMDDGQVLGDTGTFNGSSDAPLNPLNQQAEWGPSDYDQRQRFVSSVLYDPSFKVENSILRQLVNGFGFSGIITVASPFPVNALISSTTVPSFGGFVGVDAGVTGGVSSNASTTAGRVPFFQKNSFRGATQVRDVDFRITRDIPLYKERLKMQLIAEAFNLFNHTIVTSVQATAYVQANVSGGNPTLTPLTSFLTPTATSDNLITARQLQFSAKLTF